MLYFFVSAEVLKVVRYPVIHVLSVPNAELGIGLAQWGTKPGVAVVVASKFYPVTSDLCTSSVRNWRHILLATPRILRWILDFLEDLCIPGSDHV